MGMARHLDEQVLWRRARALENTQERTDMVQHYLDRHLPLLLHQSCHDHHRRRYTIF